MDLSFVDRVLKWIEDAAKAAPRMMERRRRKRVLLAVFNTSGYRWLTLRRLTTAIGLDAENPDDLDTTAKLLVHLPKPGPARADTTPPNPKQPPGPRKEQLWGLTSIVG